MNVKEIIIKANIDTDGYLLAGLRKLGKQEKKKIHRLVAQIFIPNPENKPEVNHMRNQNGIVNKKDNRFWMIEWNTRPENIQNALKDGLFPIGEKSSKAILTEKQVLEIRASNLSHTELGKIYNTNRTNIIKIVNRQRWKHI